MVFEIQGDSVKTLVLSGYEIYGMNSFSWRKKMKGYQFHIVMEYHYPEVFHLHIDKENRRGTYDNHKTIQKNNKVEDEADRIKNISESL
jgi:hypothetical protein